jgi:hypothetical protein
MSGNHIITKIIFYFSYINDINEHFINIEFNCRKNKIFPPIFTLKIYTNILPNIYNQI